MRKSLFKGLIILGTLAFLPLNQSSIIAMEFVDGFEAEVEKIPSASSILSSSVILQRPEVPQSFHYMVIELETVDFPTKQGHIPTPVAKLKKQPHRDDLKNKAGTDLQVWIRQRDEKWEPYKKDLRRWNKRKVAQEKKANQIIKPKTEDALNSAKSEDVVDQKEEIAFSQAAATVEKRRREFTGPQGYYRTWEWPEFEELMFNPVVDMYSLERPYNTLPRKKASDVNPRDLVVSFVLSPSDLKIAHRMLKRLTEDLKRELFALNKVIFFYESTFKDTVNGWSSEQLGNWWYMDGPIQKVQVEIDEAVRRQFDEDYMRKPQPLMRDLTTDRGRLLAKINRDGFGQKYHKLFFKIKERGQVDLTTIEDKWVGERYALLPKYAEPEEKKEGVKEESKEEAKEEKKEEKKGEPKEERKEGGEQEQAEKKPTFKDRYNGSDEAKERKYQDKVSKEVVIKTVTKRGFPDGLPKDFSKRFETFKVPSHAGTGKWENSNKLQMVEEVIPFESMARHRAFYHEVLWELHEAFGFIFFQEKEERKAPKWKFVGPELEPKFMGEKDTLERKKLLEEWKEIIRTPPYNFSAMSQWQYDSKILKEYREDQCKLRAFLHQQRTAHLKLHIRPTYWGITSYIPEPWRLFFGETRLKVEDFSSTTSQEIDLSDAGIKDDDIECKIALVSGTNQGTFHRLLGPYRVVNLSNNAALSGTIDYGLNIMLTKLVVRSCNISSLKFVQGLQLLEFLDLSENLLTLGEGDVEILSKLKALSYVNMSDNKLTTVEPFTPLKKLSFLNVSRNQIKFLRSLEANTALKILIARENPLSGLWKQVVPAQLDKLEELDLFGFGVEFQQEFSSGQFKERFPRLLKLHLEDEAIGWLSQIKMADEEDSDSGFQTEYSEQDETEGDKKDEI